MINEHTYFLVTSLISKFHLTFTGIIMACLKSIGQLQSTEQCGLPVTNGRTDPKQRQALLLNRRDIHTNLLLFKLENVVVYETK